MLSVASLKNTVIADLLSNSSGDRLVIIMDYMMKYEENRARECSREQFGKQCFVTHGCLFYIRLMMKLI